MSKIKDNPLPAHLNEQLVRRLKEVPDPVLEGAARENHLPGGFTKVLAIRKRLITMIEGAGVLPKWVLDLVFIPGQAAVRCLSLQTLQDLQDALASAVGPHNYALALLTDDREEVRELGVRLMTNPSEDPSTEAIDEARAALVEALEWRLAADLGIAGGPAAEAIPEPPSPTPAHPVENHPATPDEQQQRVNHLEEEIRKRHRHLENARKRHKAEKRDIEKQLRIREEHHAEERKRLRTQLEAEQSKNEFLERENQNLKQERNQAIAEGVEQETSFLKRSWLAKARAQESEVASGKDTAEDLLARAEHAVHTQAGQDRHTGNRLTLQHRLSELRDARQNVAETQRHALNPLPELGRVLAALDAEIGRLENMLGVTQGEEPITSRLLRNINQATQMADLRPVGELIQLLAAQDLLTRTDQRRLYEAIYKKYGLLEDSTRTEIQLQESDEGWNLRSLLLRNRDILVYIDGHNLLFSLMEDPRHLGKGGEAGARDRLVQSLSRLVSNAPNVKLTIFFDGSVRQTESAKPNVRVEFSGGHGEHRADRRIAEDVAYQSRQKPAPKIFVVSNDHEVRQHALQHGARYVSAEAFAALLADA